MWSPLGVSLSLSRTHIGLPWEFNFNFPTSIPVIFIWESAPRDPKIPQAEISQIPESGWGDLFVRFLNTSSADSPAGLF